MKPAKILMVTALIGTALGQAQEAEATARGVRGLYSAAGRGVVSRGIAGGLRAAKEALKVCMGVDATTAVATASTSNTVCMQTTINHINRATIGLQQGLGWFCSQSEAANGARECVSLRDQLESPRAQPHLAAQRPTQFIQEIRSRAEALNGRANNSNCQQSAQELRECLLGISQIFGTAELQRGEREQPQQPAQLPAASQQAPAGAPVAQAPHTP